MKYTDFIDLDYNPSQNDLIALFRVKPSEGISFREAAGRVASESSNGTWTESRLFREHIRRLSAKAYWMEPPWVEIAYPIDLFEEGNMPQILSSIAGNIFGMKAVKYLRLEDVYWPTNILKHFLGPAYGIKGVREILKIHDRPITATVPKPKVGLTVNEYVDAAREIWIGGVDLLKDDENLTGQSFIRFMERARKMFRLRDKAEMETGERKGYLINITAPYNEMVKRAKIVKDHGGEFVMIDILTVGWGALQSFREYSGELGLAIHAHRAFHAAFTRNRYHGMSMKVVAEISRIIGVDHLHVGAVVGKLEAPRRDVEALLRICRFNRTGRNMRLKLLEKDWDGMKPLLPVCSGGIHPGLIPRVLEIFGVDVIIQAGGGVVGHPSGPHSGAKALRDAIDAVLSGEELSERAGKSRELREALDHWGYRIPV